MNRGQRIGNALLLCAAAGWLAGCATLDDGADKTVAAAPVQLKLDNRLPGNLEANAPLLQGLFRVNAPDRLLSYKADYAVKPGAALVDPNAVADAATATVGGESFGHRLDARLPFFQAPLLVDVQDRYQGQLTEAGPGLSGARSAELSWAPDSLRLGLQWADAAAVPVPLDCAVRGSIDLPGSLITGQSDETLKLSGRGCHIAAPERGVPDLGVSAYTAAWQWQGGAGRSDVHLTMFEPQRPLQPQVDTALAHSYELGASRTQTRGNFSAKSSLAVRRVNDVATPRALTRWSARTTLSQQYRDVAVSASLQHGADPLWFLPEGDQGADQFELGVNFKRWLASRWSLPHVDMGLSWSLTRPTVPSLPLDTRVFWNFSLTH